MNGDELDTSASFTQLGLTLSSNLTWKTHIHSLANHASQNLGFLARARGFFSSSHLLTINKSQIRPSLEYCFHVCCVSPTSTICFLNKVQFEAICFIIQPLSHRFLVGDLSIFSDTFMDIALRRSGVKFLLLCGISGPLDALPTHTISKFHYLIPELYPTNHHSSQEYAIYGTSCLFVAFLNLRS